MSSGFKSKTRIQPFVPFPAGLVPVRVVHRRNRFVIEVTLDNESTTPLALHMPNTGRMSELLVPGTLGMAVLDGGGERKTAGTLLLVQYAERWVSVDARMPNRLFEQALADRFIPSLHDYDGWRAEFPWAGGRLDFKLWNGGHGATGTPSQANPSHAETLHPAGAPRAAEALLPGNTNACPPPMLVETKSCNLVEDGTALFPDAPTERGARHLADLADAVAQGYRAAVVWFVQRDDARQFAPHREVDPAFGEAFDLALGAGVEAYAYRCRVKPEGITVLDEIPVLDAV